MTSALSFASGTRNKITVVWPGSEVMVGTEGLGTEVPQRGPGSRTYVHRRMLTEEEEEEEGLGAKPPEAGYIQTACSC